MTFCHFVTLRHGLLPYFGKKLSCDIEADDVARYQKKRLESGAAPKSINLEVGTLRAILKKSGHWARIQPDIKMLKVNQDIGRAISAKEEAALLQACSTSRCRMLVPFVTLAIETGARYGVIRTLLWGNVDFANRCLKWGKDKTPAGTGRVVPLSPRAVTVLQFWATNFPDRKPGHFVFGTESYGGSGDKLTAITFGSDPTEPVGSIKEAWESSPHPRRQARLEREDRPAALPLSRFKIHGHHPLEKSRCALGEDRKDCRLEHFADGENGRHLWPLHPG